MLRWHSNTKWSLIIDWTRDLASQLRQLFGKQLRVAFPNFPFFCLVALLTFGMVATVPNLNLGFKIFSYFVASPQYLLSVVSVEALNHFSIFADLEFFGFWFQEFRKTNSGMEKRIKKLETRTNWNHLGRKNSSKIRNLILSKITGKNGG